MNHTGQETILLIDDDLHLLLALGDYLRMNGYSVSTANSGEKALEMLKDRVPDLIILDIGLPGMGGISFLRYLRDDPATTDYPVMVLTARTYLQDFFEHVSVDGFLAKPCDEKTVLTAIDDIIRKHRPEQRPGKRCAIKVLYGENDGSLSAEVIEFFTRAGHRVQLRSHGPEIVKAALSDTPDVIVMKEILPGLNGSAVATVLGNLSSTKHIPVVLYDDTIPLPGSVHPFAAEAPRGVAGFIHSTSGRVILAAAEDAYFRRHQAPAASNCSMARLAS